MHWMERKAIACSTQHAARSTQHAARSTQHAARSTQHAARRFCLPFIGADVQELISKKSLSNLQTSSDEVGHSIRGSPAFEMKR